MIRLISAILRVLATLIAMCSYPLIAISSLIIWDRRILDETPDYPWMIFHPEEIETDK